MNLDELDRLAEKATKQISCECGFHDAERCPMHQLIERYPELSARLRAAEAVCEAAEEYELACLKKGVERCERESVVYARALKTWRRLTEGEEGDDVD